MSERKPRQSLLLPILIPVGALVVIGIALLGFSRVLLGITATAAWITALIAAAGIMAIAAFTAGRKEVATTSLAAVVGGSAGIAMLTGGLALFVAEKGEEVHGPELPVVTVVALEGAAADGFETTELAAPSDEPFLIEFDNQDPTAPHNVWIATANPQEDPAAEILFQESEFIGPRTIEWQVEPLAEGEYFFYCSIHPATMTGTLTASPGGGGGLSVSAEGLAFDTAVIELPANTPSTITFDNLDENIPHNLSIYADEGYTEPILQEDLFDGPATVTYEVPALEPGTYFFKCDAHPTMLGTVEVAEAADGGGEPTGATGGG